VAAVIGLLLAIAALLFRPLYGQALQVVKDTLVERTLARTKAQACIWPSALPAFTLAMRS